MQESKDNAIKFFVKHVQNLLNQSCIQYVFASKLEKCPNSKKRGKSLFIQDLPRYYKFMLFADYSSTAACAAAKRAIGTRKGEQLT